MHCRIPSCLLCYSAIVLLHSISRLPLPAITIFGPGTTDTTDTTESALLVDTMGTFAIELSNWAGLAGALTSNALPKWRSVRWTAWLNGSESTSARQAERRSPRT